MSNQPINLILLDYPGASLAAVAGLQEMFTHVARLHKRDGMAQVTLTVATSDNLPTTAISAEIGRAHV